MQELNTDEQEKVNIKDAGALSSQKGKKVLLIEDDKFLCDLMIRKLKDEDFEVFVAMDGEEGLRSAIENKPDLILLDLILPAMDGFEVLERIRQNELIAEMPVIILSNLWEKDDVERAMKLGAKDYLIKAHFTLNEIVDKVRTFL